MSINKKTTKKSRDNEKVVTTQKTFFDKLRRNHLSVSTWPTWMAIILLVLYTAIKPWTDSQLDYGIFFTVMGLAIIATGVIAIKKKEYPGVFSLYTEAAATNLGWLCLIFGSFIAIKGILLIIQNL